jgi:hypothetical protein
MKLRITTVEGDLEGLLDVFSGFGALIGWPGSLRRVTGLFSCKLEAGWEASRILERSNEELFKKPFDSGWNRSWKFFSSVSSQERLSKAVRTESSGK